MPPRPQKRRKGNEEEGANDAAVPLDDVNVEALVAVKQEQNGNLQENRVKENQAEESAMSMVLEEMRSMREEMKGVKQEMNEKMESIFEELISGKLSEVRKEIAALKQLYKFRSNEELKAAARLWCTDRNKAIAQYGHISSWNHSSIMIMVLLFGLTDVERDQGNHWNKDFNEDLSGWDISNVTDMAWMFNGAESFTSDLSRWSVGNCTNMRCMFQHAKSFKSDLKEWNVEKVTDMAVMFYNVASFKSDFSGWSTDNCTNMYGMFSGASSFNRGTIRNWDLSSITGSTVDTVENGKEKKQRAVHAVIFHLNNPNHFTFYISKKQTKTQIQHLHFFNCKTLHYLSPQSSSQPPHTPPLPPKKPHPQTPP